MKQPPEPSRLRRWAALVTALLAGLTHCFEQLRAHEPEPIEFSEVGIPYSWRVELDDSESAVISGQHVGAWSWDEDSFPATTRGWTHTSCWVQVELSRRAALTLTLQSEAGVAWPSAEDPGRLAGTNLFPSFTIYRGVDTDKGVSTNTAVASVDQDHTYNNRGNIEWAEDVAYLDHLDNATAHRVARTWVLEAGIYSFALGGNSPSTLAEGRQGLMATFATAPVQTLARGAAIIDYDKAAWESLASGFGAPPVLVLNGFFDATATSSLTADALLTNVPPASGYLGQVYLMNPAEVVNPAGRTAQPTSFAWTPGSPTRHGGTIGMAGIARFGVFGGAAGNLLFGDLTLGFDASRIALGGSGWHLRGNIPPVGTLFDLVNVSVSDSSRGLTVAGDLAISFEIANFLFNTPADTLRAVGKFHFAGYTATAPGPRLLNPSVNANGVSVRVVEGVPGARCQLLSSSEVHAPTGQWEVASSVEFDAAGEASLVLPMATGVTAQYFRLRQP